MSERLLVNAACIVIFIAGFYVGLTIGSIEQVVTHKNYNYDFDMSDLLDGAQPVGPPRFNLYDPDDETFETISAPKITSVYDSEFNCMIKTIYFEAGNQSYLGKLAVGSVVMNRVEDSNYPETVCGVVKQHKQFSWFWDGKSDEPNPNEHTTWMDSVKAAEDTLIGMNSIFDDTRVQYYHANYVNPSWSRDMHRVAQIGAHIFYRRK